MGASLNITIDKIAVDGLIQGLKVAGRADYIGKNIDMKEVSKLSLAALKDLFFPVSSASQPFPREDYRGHLETGWRAFIYPPSYSEIGFEIRNVKADDNPRVQTILSSLDKGSRGYIRELGNKKALSFIGKPGRATRPSDAYSPFIFTSRHIYIPARRPLHYIEKTRRFVEDLLVKRIPGYARGLRTDLRKWANKD